MVRENIHYPASITFFIHTCPTIPNKGKQKSVSVCYFFLLASKKGNEKPPDELSHSIVTVVLCELKPFCLFAKWGDVGSFSMGLGHEER